MRIMNKGVRNNTRARTSTFSLEQRLPEGPFLRPLQRAWHFLRVAVLFTLLGGGLSAEGAVDVWLYHNHLSRDGLYISPVFTNSAVSKLTLDTAFNGTVTGNVYAQ